MDLHTVYNKHLRTIRVEEDPTCRAYCEDEKDSQRMVGECLAMRSTWLRYLRSQLSESEIVKKQSQLMNEVNEDTKLMK